MTTTDTTYQIAGVKVSVHSLADAMRHLSEWDLFRIHEDNADTPSDEDAPAHSDEIVSIHLLGGEPQRATTALFHTIATPLHILRFHYEALIYEMEIMSHDGATLLTSLHYKVGSAALVRGDLSPVTLRFALWTAFNTIAAPTHHVFALHTSAVVIGGKAFLFLGESGTGKSTHTSLIQERFPEARLLNDDSPILRIENNHCLIYGSPWSGKTPCYHTEHYPLGGIVRLSQAKQNIITPLSTFEALTAVLPSFPPELYLCEYFRHAVHAALSTVIEHTPVYHLACLPDTAAAELSVSTLTHE